MIREHVMRMRMLRCDLIDYDDGSFWLEGRVFWHSSFVGKRGSCWISYQTDGYNIYIKDIV